MKIPEKVRIGGVEYDVLRNVEGLNDGQRMLAGQIDYSECEIRLSEIEFGKASEGLTLWHEVLHGVVRHMGLQIENEEETVEQLSKGIYAVLQDNATQLWDLK